MRLKIRIKKIMKKK